MKHLLLLAVVMIIPPLCANARTDEASFLEKAAEAGHRDIHLSVNGDTLRVSYWPLGFRNEYVAFTDFRKRIAMLVQGPRYASVKQVELYQTSWGMSLLQTGCIKNASIKTHTFRRFFSLRPVGNNYTAYHPSKKILVQINIPLVMSFGDFYDPLVFKTGIRPDIRYVVRPGIIVYNQFDLYVHNEYDRTMWFRPANIGLVVLKPFTESLLSVTNIGAFFQRDLYGIDEEIIYSLRDDMYVRFHLGAYHTIGYENYHVEYERNVLTCEKKTMIASMHVLNDRYDGMIVIKAGRFLNGDRGVGLGVFRLFYDVEIGFSGVYSDNEFNGYIDVSLPLPPGNRSSFASHGIAPAREFRLKYRYNSRTITFDPDEKPKGIEHELGISFREIMGFTRTEHFRHLAGTAD